MARMKMIIKLGYKNAKGFRIAMKTISHFLGNMESFTLATQSQELTLIMTGDVDPTDMVNLLRKKGCPARSLHYEMLPVPAVPTRPATRPIGQGLIVESSTDHKSCTIM